MKRHLITVLIAMIIAGNGWSQSSITAQAFAEVIEALTVQENDQLNFGRFSPETNGGNIVISPEGIRSTQGTVILASGPHNPGRFTITGAPDATFTIQLPDGPSVLTHQGSSKTMIVEGWVSDPPAGIEASTLPDGSRLVSIGAVLNVGPIEDNPVGIYAGTFQLTFSYN